MRYIKLTKEITPAGKTKIPIVVKIGGGLLIFILILLYFIFSEPGNLIFDRGGLDQTSGRTNILILGSAGAAMKGGNLTDTIIVASVDLESFDVALISIPRDLWIPDLGAKVNSAYVKGEEESKGEGLKSAKKIAERVVGVSVHYAVRVDFDGFVRAVDLLGGIDVEVEKGFQDFKYPIAGAEDATCGYTITEVEIDGVRKVQVLTATGAAVLSADPFFCRYEQIAFSAGLQHMDGATALKFVRSRMGINGSGSDFDRSQRQKQVILAIVAKVFDLRNLFSPKKVVEIVQTFGKNVDTDFTEEEFSRLPAILSQLNEFKFRNLVLSSQGETPLLYTPSISEYGAWVLLPVNGDWENLQQVVKNFIEEPDSKKQATKNTL